MCEGIALMVNWFKVSEPSQLSNQIHGLHFGVMLVIIIQSNIIHQWFIEACYIYYDNRSLILVGSPGSN